jgi:hypothetical protein
MKIFVFKVLNTNDFDNQQGTFKLALKCNATVVTLALGLRPKQGLAKLRAKKETRKSCHMLLGVQENVRD